MKIKKILIRELLEYIFIIFVVFECNSVYRVADTNYYIPELGTLLVVCVFFAEIMRYGISREMLKKMIALFIPYFILMLVFMNISVSPDNMVTFFARFVIVLPITTYIICSRSKRDGCNFLLYKFVNVMVFLSVCSLVLWILGSLQHILSPNTVIEAYWGGKYIYKGYFGLLFERQYDESFGFKIMRNQGIFTEGPMYSLCLVISIGSEMFLKSEKEKKYSIKKLIILTAAVITTFTTTGFILTLIIYALAFLKKMPKDKILKILKTFISIIAVIVVAFIVRSLYIEKSSSYSWMIRMMHYTAEFRAWMHSPIFGNGYGDYLKANLIGGINMNGSSNAIFSVLSQGGIVLFFTYLFAFGMSLRGAVKHDEKGMIFFILIIAIEFCVTLFQYTFLMLLILAVFYAYGFMKEKG